MALVPFSNEILVNNANTTTQQTPAIAIDSDGDYVVIWESVGQDDPTQTIRTGLFGQRFTFSGTKVGSEFQVNTTTNDNQGQPAVVYDPLSGFTVVWDSFGQDGNNYGVYSKRYNSAGVAQTGDTLVNTTTTGLQRDPVIGRDGAGNYVVVWRGSGSGGDTNGVYFQRFSAAGTALGGETLVNTASTDLETQPAVAMNASGAFVVAYTITNGTDSEVFVRLYNSSGIAVSNPIQVNVTTTSAQNSPVVAIDNNGNFVVVWESSQNSGTGIDLYGRRFSSTGAALSGEFLISTVTAGNQSNAAIALDANGNFTVAWQSVGQDGSGSGIYARQFSSAGVASGAEFLVNQTTTGDQVEPTIAMQTKGDFAIAWRDQSSGNGDIYVRSYSTNNPPTGLTLSTTSINENILANSTIGNFSTTDPDIGDTFTYTLVTGAGSSDNSAFNIVGNQLRINSSPNFEAKNSYSIRIRTTDQRGLIFESPFTITINNVNETPTALALSAVSINENVAANSVVGNFSTTDPDTGNTFTYSLVPGTGSTDNAAFSIVGNQLRINNSPDFETKSSYTIRVRTTDQGGLTFESPFTITVNDLAENTAPTAIALSATNIDENVAANSVVGNFSTTDPDTGNTFTYSLVAGDGSTDNAAFSIVGNQLRINNSPDFETKSSYSIRIRTTDQGGLTFESPFTITVNDLAENTAPTALALSATSIDENVAANSVVANFSTTDPDTGNTFTYSLVAGDGSTDNAAFSIVGNQLRINNSPDFETKSSYSIRIRTTDQGGLSFESPFTITVNDLAENTAPTALALSATSIDENVAANSVVANFSTTDPDTGNTFTYSLVAGDGSTDNAAFSIVGNQLRINNSPDFETKSSYSIRIRTTDQGGLTFESPFTININNVNETPTAIALSATNIDENVAANSVVGNFSTTDPDTGNTFTYSLVPGTGSTDNVAFSIVGNQLRINNSPDFETKSSYSIRIRTTDQGGLIFESPFTITINNLAEQNIINGTANSDILKGTAQDDIITGFKKADLIITGAGRDSIVYTSLNDGIDLISDFSVGNDKIVLTSLLDSIIPGGYNGTNAIADGYVRVRTLLGNINLIFSVDIDADGIGNSKSFQSLTTITGFDLTLSRLNNPSNFVF